MELSLCRVSLDSIDELVLFDSSKSGIEMESEHGVSLFQHDAFMNESVEDLLPTAENFEKLKMMYQYVSTSSALSFSKIKNVPYGVRLPDILLNA